MANRRFDRDWCLGERCVQIWGSFGTNGGAAIVASTVKGFGFGYAPVNGVMTLQPNRSSISLTTTPGIVLSGTGIYTVTLEDPYIDLVSVGVSIQASAQGVNANDMIVGTVTNLGSSTAAPAIQLFTVNGGTGAAATPTAANANSRVNFTFIFRDSTVQFNKP
jgi:L-serine deaminase